MNLAARRGNNQNNHLESLAQLLREWAPIAIPRARFSVLLGNSIRLLGFVSLGGNQRLFMDEGDLSSDLWESAPPSHRAELRCNEDLFCTALILFCTQHPQQSAVTITPQQPLGTGPEQPCAIPTYPSLPRY